MAFAVLGPAGTRAGVWGPAAGMGLFRAAVPTAVMAIVAAIGGMLVGGRALRGLGVVALAVAASIVPTAT
jgi:hypothetical protein